MYVSKKKMEVLKASLVASIDMLVFEAVKKAYWATSEGQTLKALEKQALDARNAIAKQAPIFFKSGDMTRADIMATADKAFEAVFEDAGYASDNGGETPPSMVACRSYLAAVEARKQLDINKTVEMLFDRLTN